MSAGLRLLASVLRDGSTSTLRQFDSDLLVDTQERDVYDFIKTHFRSYSQLPELRTVEEETGVELPTVSEPVDFYFDEVRNRNVYNVARRIFPVLREHVLAGDVSGMLDTSSAIRRVCLPYSGQQVELLSVDDGADAIQESYESAKGLGGLVGVPTGWGHLDDQTGGWQNSDLIFFASRPEVGKTHLLIHQARMAAKSGKSVLFISMEMGLTQILKRWVAHEASVDPKLVRNGKLGFLGDRRFQEGLDRLRDQHNVHLYAGNFNKTTEDIDILVQELNPDAVYVDGFYLVSPAKKGSRSLSDSTTYVTDELKRIALMRDRPIICTTKLNRQGVGGGTLENLGYSDAISTHASIIFVINYGYKKRVIDYSYMEGKWNDNNEYYEERNIVSWKDHYPTRIIKTIKGREGESTEFGINFKFTPFDFNVIPMAKAIGESQDQVEMPNIDYMETQQR